MTQTRSPMAAVLVSAGLAAGLAAGLGAELGTAAAADAAPAGVRSNAVVERRALGTSVEGRTIWAYRKGNPDARLKVVVLGQMHGNERAGVQTARYLKNKIPVRMSADVWVVPTMNPDGHAADSRYNANGVDLNRNFPANWKRGRHTGPKPASAPETRAMIRFLKQVRPRFVASIHQPFGVVSFSDKNPPYVRRLSQHLGLPIDRVQVGPCKGAKCPPSPTLTSWHNTRLPGTSVTIEYPRPTKLRFRTIRAGRGILRATRAY